MSHLSPQRSLALPMLHLLVGLGLGLSLGTTGPPARADVAPSPSGVLVETLARTTRSWNGAALPSYGPGQPQVTILRITIPPGVRLPLHHHPVINAGVLLEGRLRVVAADGGELELKAGDPIVEMVNAAHYGENVGTVPATIVVVYAGLEGQPVTVLEGKGSAASSPGGSPPAP
jgi:quercetin dioxygenase-like cupin family protein